MRGNLCKLFSRSTEMNIAIYVISALTVIVFGTFWIYGKTRNNNELEIKWHTRSYITLVSGLIIVAFMMGFNMIYYELSFNEKCKRLETFINQQIEAFRTRLNAGQIGKEASRVVLDTFSKELKNNLPSILKSALMSGLSSSPR